MTCNNSQSYDTPIAPLGLGGICSLMCYTPIAPLELFRSGKMLCLPDKADIGIGRGKMFRL